MANDNDFRLAAFGAVLAAVYHAAALVVPRITSHGAPWRHALFIGIDLAVAVLLIQRPRWFAGAFGVLTLQQLFSHGNRLFYDWLRGGQVAWVSLGVCIALPVIAARLIIDRGRDPIKSPLNPL